MHFSVPRTNKFKFLLALFSAAILTALWITYAYAANNLLGGTEPLPPEKVFIPTIKQVNDDSITVEFTIEDGYYLYRDKTHVGITTTGPDAATPPTNEGIALAPPVYPEAILVNDEFFGEMAIYRQGLIFELPYSRTTTNTQAELSVKFQGCADMGLCYPPITTRLSLELPPAAESIENNSSQTTGKPLFSTNNASELASPVGSSSARNSLLGGNDNEAQPELLPPELAYLPQIASADASQISVRWFIESGYYLYRDKLSFTLQQAGDVKITHVSLDEGINQHDEFFGDVKVFRDSANAQLSLEMTGNASELRDATLQIHYQGCADIGVCFPPSNISLPVAFNKVTSSSTGAGSATDAPLPVASLNTSTPAGKPVQTTAAVAGTVEQSEQDRLFSLLGSNSLWLTILTFFGLGLLLAFTPCVLPMVPILSSMIVGQGENMSTAKAFRLSLVYVLVMASTYALVGIIVGLSGYNVQAFLQNPWVLSGIAVLFVLLSLSMFGFYELQMPTSIQTKLANWSNKQGSGQIAGVAAMGFISTLIVGPCVTAPLAGALIYIAKTGDAMVGGAALFSLGLGMGAPLLLIGTSAGKLVPRAGAWMDTTKHIFGILMLAMAIYMISRFLPTATAMALYGILAIMTGIHFGATDTLTKESREWQRFGKGVGIVISVYGLALLLGALAGGNSYTKPLRSVLTAQSNTSTVSATEHGLVFAPVKGLDGLQQVVDQARRDGKPVMLDFYADWCISCKEMEAYTFSDETVQRLLASAVVVQADVTANDAADQALLKHFDLFGPPGIIFYDGTGTELPAARVVGFMSAEKFSAHLQKIL